VKQFNTYYSTCTKGDIWGDETSYRTPITVHAPKVTSGEMKQAIEHLLNYINVLISVNGCKFLLS